MNKIYKVIWNSVLNRYDVVSEFARAGKKCRSSVSLAEMKSVKKDSVHEGICPSQKTLCSAFVAMVLGAFMTFPLSVSGSTIVVTDGSYTDYESYRDSSSSIFEVGQKGSLLVNNRGFASWRTSSYEHNSGALYVHSGGYAKVGGVYINADNTNGIYVDGPGSRVHTEDNTVYGGMAAYNGGELNLGSDIINLRGLDYGLGVVASGNGSKISGQATITSWSSSQDTNVALVKAESGGKITLSGKVLSPDKSGTGVLADGGSVEGTISLDGGALARNGGDITLRSGSTVDFISNSFRNSALVADGMNSHITTSANLKSGSGGIQAIGGGKVDVLGGLLSTTGTDAMFAAYSGVIDIATADVISSANISGHGIEVSNGGVVNLAGGTLNIKGDNSTALDIQDPLSAITSSAPLTVNTSGNSDTTIALGFNASQDFTNLTGVATGDNAVLLRVNPFQNRPDSVNKLTLTDSSLRTEKGTAIVGAGGKGILDLTLSGTTLSGPQLIQDGGGVVNVIASNHSELTGTAQADNSSITLNSDSVWNMGAGDSSMGTLALDKGTLVNTGDGSLNTINNITLGGSGGTFDTQNFDALLTGSSVNGQGSLTKTGSGSLTLASGIDYAGKTNINNGTLRIGNGAAAGEVHLNQVDNNGTLVFNRPDLVTVDMIAGTGSVVQEGSGTTLISGDSSYLGGTSVRAGTLQLGDGGSTGSVLGDIDVGSDGILAIVRNGAITLGNTLKGAGLVTTDTAGKAFDFALDAVNAFSGTLAVGNGTFALDGKNTETLSNASLRAGSGSIVTVGKGVQTIGGLAFDGGTMKFSSGTPGETVAQNVVHTTNELDLRGAGSIEVNIGNVDNSHKVIKDSLSLLEQDDTNTLLQLVSSETPALGSGGNLVLKDQNGNLISDAIKADITQNGAAVAQGTYDYRLSSSENNDGLYVAYGLKEVELQGSGEQALSLSAAGKTGNAADLSAKITGSGDLTIDTNYGNAISLSNLENNYTGKTNVRSGTLQMSNDNVLGNTAQLHLAELTALNMNGYRQTVGKLIMSAGSLLNLNGGELTLSQGGISEGELTGSGKLTIAGDKFSINGKNENLASTTTITSNAQVEMNDVAGLGSGNIINAGMLTLQNAVGKLTNAISDAGRMTLQNSSIMLTGDNSLFSGLLDIEKDSQVTVTRANQLGDASVKNAGTIFLDSDDSWVMGNNLTGNGALIKNGAGTISLTTGASYTGQTEVHSGGLLLGNPDEPMTLASNNVKIAEAGFMGGYGTVAGNINNAGALFVGIPEGQSPSGRMSTASQVFTVGGDLNNSGKVFVGHQNSEAGNQLVVNGNYIGNNGQLHFNSVLGDDHSTTDTFVVNGNTSGVTHVSVDNAGGAGAQTLEGIELIQVNGLSDGEFVQNGRIVAGAYDYSLVRGKKSNSANWYLTSFGDTTEPPTDPQLPTDPEKPVKPGQQIQRPEAGSYTANLAAANNMFITRLHDRLGETQYTDLLTGEKKVTSMWMRNEGGHNRSHDTSGQLSTQSNRYVLQLGGDIAQWSNDGQDRFHLGIMAGYGNDKSSTRSSRSGYRSAGKVNGYTTGVYGTWYANEEDKTGLYVDGWAQYSWFNNSVQGDGLAHENYKSKGVTASVESGYTFNLGSNADKTKNYFVQPKVQITKMGVKADKHREKNGTTVSGLGNDNIQTRLGIRTYMKGKNIHGQEFQPFVEANWISNSKDFGTSMNGTDVKQAGAKNIGELKAGIEGNITKNVNLWSNVNQQMGGKGYSDTSVSVGVKYTF